MSFRVYLKKGNTNYKEKKLVAKLNDALVKNIDKNPDFLNDFKPATNFQELQALHDKYVIESVNFEEVKTQSTEQNTTPMAKEEENTMVNPDEEKTIEKDTFKDDGQTFVDPMNREEPIVRDYVTNDEQPNETKGAQTQSTKTTFDEPVSFQQAFEMPSDDPKDSKTAGQGSFAGTQQKQQQQQKTQQVKQNPINPQWDDMNNGKKKRSTKKFAKYIVEVVCMLSEKGFVWYANKDINDVKLAEYEISGEYDLDLLVNLEDGQEATIKQFFQIQCAKAEAYSKIDPTEKEDLIEALAEVMFEKGVGPTPIQELGLVALKIFGGQAIALFSLKSQTNDLLAQIRVQKEERVAPPVQRQTVQQPVAKQEEKPVAKTEAPEAKEEDTIQHIQDAVIEEESGIIETPVNTLE